MWFVYILKCSDGPPYVGCTTDIERRIHKHNSHKVHYAIDKTHNELLEKFNISTKALNQILSRLESKTQIVQIRKEFYAIY